MSIKCIACGSPSCREVEVPLPPPDTPGVHTPKTVTLIDCLKCGWVAIDRSKSTPPASLRKS